MPNIEFVPHFLYKCPFPAYQNHDECSEYHLFPYSLYRRISLILVKLYILLDFFQVLLFYLRGSLL